MHQITFRPQSQAVLKHLPKEQQLELVNFLTGLDEAALDVHPIHRDHHVFHRLRWKQFRLYIECAAADHWAVHYLIPKHTWEDFLFRTNLPFNEDALEADKRFWELLKKL